MRYVLPPASEGVETVVVDIDSRVEVHVARGTNGNLATVIVSRDSKVIHLLRVLPKQPTPPRSSDSEV